MKCGSSTATIEKFDCEVIDAYADAGVEAMEIALPLVNYYAHDWKELKKHADERNVEIWSIHMPFNETYNIAQFDRDNLKEIMRIDEELLKKSGEIGIKAAVIHSSFGVIPEEERERYMEMALMNLDKLTQIAKSEGIHLAAEVLPGRALGCNSDELKYMTEQISDLKVCFDVNHLYTESHEDFVEKMGDKIVTVHISDYDFVQERHWLPGKGKNDWKKIIELLNSINYNGAFMYEVGRAGLENDFLGGIRKNYDKIMRGEI